MIGGAIASANDSRALPEREAVTRRKGDLRASTLSPSEASALLKASAPASAPTHTVCQGAGASESRSNPMRSWPKHSASPLWRTTHAPEAPPFPGGPALPAPALATHPRVPAIPIGCTCAPATLAFTHAPFHWEFPRHRPFATAPASANPHSRFSGRGARAIPTTYINFL